MLKKINYKNGFTLIELMVSVSIFVIVVMISMGAIFTVVDANKKAQTLKSVMNNLNFALETMTRTIKTGTMPASVSGDSITVLDQVGNSVTYKLSGADTYGRKHIDRSCIENPGSKGPCDPSGAITAPEVGIGNLKFIGVTTAGKQPSVVMIVQGTSTLSSTISSRFDIQTTITQRLPAN